MCHSGLAQPCVVAWGWALLGAYIQTGWGLLQFGFLFILLQARLVTHSPVVFREQMPCIVAIYDWVNAHQYCTFLETWSHGIQSGIQTRDLSILRRSLCHPSYSALVSAKLLQTLALNSMKNVLCLSRRIWKVFTSSCCTEGDRIKLLLLRPRRYCGRDVLVRNLQKFTI